MPYIETVAPADAKGSLKRLYEEAIRRAGKVFNVVRIQSLQPRVLGQSTALYTAIMRGESGISRAERELLAVVVSAVNGCHY